MASRAGCSSAKACSSTCWARSLGLPLGYGLAQYLAIVYDTEMFRFPIVTPPKIWIEAIVLGFVFAIIAHVIVQRAINKLDWLDASKTKE